MELLKGAVQADVRLIQKALLQPDHGPGRAPGAAARRSGRRKTPGRPKEMTWNFTPDDIQVDLGIAYRYARQVLS